MSWWSAATSIPSAAILSNVSQSTTNRVTGRTLHTQRQPSVFGQASFLADWG
jgi:hypothetical protein